MSVIQQPVRSVREQIADQLRNEIIADQHPANAPLREANLAKRFGTSRGPIRDVLLQLSQEGALTYTPNVGVKVGNPLDSEDRELLISLRRQIEIESLTRGWGGLTEEDRNVFREALEAMRVACQKKNMAAIAGADIGLHREIVRRTGSADLEAIWLSIVVRIRMTYTRLARHLEIYREHVPIVDAIVNQDKKAALRALERNII